jgi:methanogenic corrinoid protein MtbC1
MATGIQISSEIEAKRPAIAAAIARREFERLHAFGQSSGFSVWQTSVNQANGYLSALAGAMALDNRALFFDYVAWAKVRMLKQGFNAGLIEFHLQAVMAALREYLSVDLLPPVDRFIDACLQAFPEFPEEVEPFLEQDAPYADLAREYLHALLHAERRAASRMILDAADRGAPVQDLYLHVFQPVQYEIGRLWQTNRISVAWEHYCTAATQLIMSQLYPRIFSSQRHRGTMMAASISGNLHEIGVRMVADFFEIAGWSTFYLGVNTPLPDILSALREHHPDLLAVSVCVLIDMKALEELIGKIRSDPSLDGLKLIVGGRLFNIDPELWRKVGADGYAPDAKAAVALAQRLLP